MIGRNRVVITGVGVLAANGIGKEAFWNSLLTGESGVGPTTLCDVSSLSSRVAGEVKNFDPTPFLDGKIKPKRITRQTQLAVAAAKMALADSGLNLKHLQLRQPISLMVGTALGGFDFIESQIRRIVSKGNGSMLPTVIGCVQSAPASTIACLLEVACEAGSLGNGCAAGLDAVAKSYMKIRDGGADIALAGGADAPIETSLIAGFCSANMLSTRNEEPATANCPFDRRHELGALGEGGAFVVLEEYSHALERGARPLAEIIGYSTCCDTQGQLERGLHTSMSMALSNAAIYPEEIDYINAHGASDAESDIAETNAIRSTFGKHAYSIPVGSIKGATANPLAAGGVMQLICSVMGMHENQIPPTTNHEVAALDCDLDYIPIEPRQIPIRHALINACGIGNIYSSLIIKGLC